MSLETAMGPDPFSGKTWERKPEEIVEVGVEEDPLVERILEKHHFCVKYVSSLFREKIGFLSELEVDALTPSQINRVLQEIIDRDANVLDEVTGLFLGRLIQVSYDAGYNDFVLTTGDYRVNYFGRKLEGLPEKKLKMGIQGNVGYGFGVHSQYAAFTVHGSVGEWSASDSKFCALTIEENVEKNLGCYSKQNTFIIGGEIGERCGHGSRNSTFITYNKETYKQMKKSVPKSFFWFLPGGNKVVYQPK